VGSPNFRGDGLQRHGLRAVGEQNPACRFESDGSAFLRVEAFAAY
jgi:hypothetical protein